MLQSKDITNLGELKTVLKVKEKAVDTMVDFISLFEFKTVIRKLDDVKKRGYASSGLFSVLMILPFIGQSSIYALFKSGYSHLSEAQKDTYYRLKNNFMIDWRKMLWLFAKRYRKIIDQRTEAETKTETETSSQAITCFVIDDSTLAKMGKKIEKIGKVWDHVVHSYILGFKLLCLGWYDGKSFIPLDFSLHREKGKNAKKPYGLTLRERKAQFGKSRPNEAKSKKRIKGELNDKKTDTALAMIKRGVKHGFVPKYVLMDSWFSSEKLIKGIRKLKKGSIHIVAMFKMGTAKYTYEGEDYSAKQLLRKLKQTKKRCRKLNATYIEVLVAYKGTPLKLFFSRYGKNDKWHLVGTTNQSLSFIKTMEIYQIRWSIEVFFKETKQYLGLGKCQSNDLDAHFADLTITMMQYILMTLKKRFEDYETQGELFRFTGQQMQETTLHERLWGLFIELVTTLAELVGIDPNELLNDIFNNECAYQAFKRFMRKENDKIPAAA